MTAQQADAAAVLPDLDPTSMGVISVPEVWPPLDGPPAGPGSPGPGVDLSGRRPGPGDSAPDMMAEPSGAHRGVVPPGDEGAPWPRQFAVLLAEALAGVRPLQQVLPWMSGRGSVQLRRLLPLFCGDYRPRILRVLTATPSPDVIEMTLVVTAGPRTRALAVRLERAAPPGQPTWRDKPATSWLCTDIEAA